MNDAPHGRNEKTPEGRIAEQVFRINRQVASLRGLPGNLPMHADIADYREGLRLYMRRELLTALRDEARQIASIEAIRKARVLYLESRELELQRELDKINAEIALLEAA
jgi:hypothetical protein